MILSPQPSPRSITAGRSKFAPQLLPERCRYVTNAASLCLARRAVTFPPRSSPSSSVKGSFLLTRCRYQRLRCSGPKMSLKFMARWRYCADEPSLSGRDMIVLPISTTMQSRPKRSASLNTETNCNGVNGLRSELAVPSTAL
jgi:hypothetical protein